MSFCLLVWMFFGSNPVLYHLVFIFLFSLWFFAYCLPKLDSWENAYRRAVTLGIVLLGNAIKMWLLLFLLWMFILVLSQHMCISIQNKFKLFFVVLLQIWTDLSDGWDKTAPFANIQASSVIPFNSLVLENIRCIIKPTGIFCAIPPVKKIPI